MDVFLERKIKMIGIIDIGTNTIRLVVYENGKKIIEKGVASEITRYTENGNLNQIGIKNLYNSILYLLSVCENAEVHIIATEAFRKLKNRDEVKKEVLLKCKTEIEILTGEEEAECVFYGTMGEIGTENSGIIVDLGGGSLEIINFEKKMVKNMKSYPLGTKVVKNKFSANIIPTDEEIKSIENYIEENLNTEKSFGNLYMVGGTGKTALKIINLIKNENSNIISEEDFDKILSFIKEMPEEKLKIVFQNRYETIYTGIVIIRKIASILGKDKIHIVKSGVREGYLKKEMKL